MGALLIALALWALPLAVPAAGSEITIRYAGDLPIGNHLTRTQEFFAKRVAEITKGRVRVEVYPAGQLFAAKDYVKAVPAGAVDMAQSLMGQWTGLAPIFMITDVMLLYDGWEHIWRALDSAEIGEVMKKEGEKAGIRLLFWTQDASAGFVSKTPLKTLADWKGKKIRSYTELASYTIKALGGAPAFMGGGEVYMALQRGTVDGAISTLSSFYDRKYFEVTKHLTIPSTPGPIYGGVMNIKRWETLPADVKEMLLAAGKDTQEFARKEVVRMDKESVEQLKQKGMDVYPLPKEEREQWKKISVPQVEKVVVDRLGDRGKRMIELAEKMR
ncbi:MAG: TRAP transporter substrate-binding protein [Candidatus Methylomirabilales bacterium]